MDNRSQQFTDKFKSAQNELRAQLVNDIISFKFKENVNHSEYQHFLDYIRHDLNLSASQVSGNYQGQAWLITDENDNKLIIVEHETGLEILAVLGYIYTVRDTLLLLSYGWNYLKDRFFSGRFGHPGGTGKPVEIRKFDSGGNKLIERPIVSVESYVLNLGFEENKKLIERVAKLEKEMAKLKETKNNKRKGRI